MDSSTIEPVEVVREIVAALNRGAIADVLRLCAADIVLWSPSLDSSGQTIRGKEQLRQHLEFAEESWPGMWMSIDSIVAAGERVALELTSVLSTEHGQIVVPMAAFYAVREGLVVEQRNYFDLAALDRRLSA